MSTYKSTQPLSQRANGQWLPSDSVDFLLDYAGQEILQNSIRISGFLNVTMDEAPLVGNEDIKFDCKVGAHGLVQQYIVSASDKVIQNFQFVPRWVAMSESARNSEATTGGTLSNSVARKAVKDEDTTILMAGGPMSFSFKPHICLNNSDQNLPYSKFGQVKMTLILSSLNQFLYGANVNENTSWYITDLQLQYKTVPETPKGVIKMENVTSIKQTVSSGQNQLSVVCPIASSDLACSFVPLQTEQGNAVKYTRLVQLPGVSRVESSYNDLISSAALNFPLENAPEISLNYLSAMGWSGITTETSAGDYYGIGFGFGDRVLPNTKIGLYIESEVANGEPFAAYMYFKGIMEV